MTHKEAGAIRSYVLKRFVYYASTRFPKEFAGQIETAIDYHPLVDDLVLTLVAHVAGESAAKIECKWPRDWWQAFRARWWPQRYLEKYPVQYERRELVADAILPTLELPPGYPVSIVLHEKTTVDPSSANSKEWYEP
jgi:hypothetical protein